ncbi:MAG: hypothetical protein JXC85_06205 [Candidatus Aenigmarchaeota archaeon]|nr:hypothetical protein [Candidatus Aenigmarchaeota archaeon]
MEKVKKVGLDDFIEENHNLLTVFGVFAALTALFSRIGESGNDVITISIYMASMSFLMLIMIAWVIWTKFPKSEKASDTIKIFEFLYLGLLLSMSLFVLLTYKNTIKSFSFLIFFALYTTITVKLIGQREIPKKVRKLMKKHKKIRTFIAVTVALMFILVVFILAHFSSQAFNQYF